MRRTGDVLVRSRLAFAEKPKAVQGTDDRRSPSLDPPVVQMAETGTSGRQPMSVRLWVCLVSRSRAWRSVTCHAPCSLSSRNTMGESLDRTRFCSPWHGESQ